MAQLPYANKELGQHFLRDPKVIQKITSDYAEVATNIVEIGPGPAVLTSHLAAWKKDLYVIEMDERFIPFLEQHVPLERIFMQDALKFDWKQLPLENIWLVSNLPYNISAPLLISFIPEEKIQWMTLMFQKEVAEKSLMPANQKNSTNSLGILSHTYFEVSSLIKVYPGAFQPPPKVDSLVVSYKRRSTPLVPLNEFKRFESFLRGIFSQKRKQLQTVFKALGWTAGEKAPIDMIRRAESLTITEIIDLYKNTTF